MDDSELSNILIEDGIADTSVKKRSRKKHLYSQILKQMEFYFSDANLSRDRFLFQLYQQDRNVPLDIFLLFNKIRALTSDVNEIVKALGRSQFLRVSDDGKSVYRTSEIREKKNQEDCIIYIEQLPPDADHDWVSGIFSAYGEVEYVSIPKYKNRAAIKGFAFVEFDTPDAAKKALEAFGSVGGCLPPQMPPEELCSIATYEDQEINFKQIEDSPPHEEILEGEKKRQNKPDSLEEVEELSEEEFSEPKPKKVKLEEHSPENKEKIKIKKMKDHMGDVKETETDDVSVKKSRKRKIEEHEDNQGNADDLIGESGTANQETGDSSKKKKKNKKKGEDGTAGDPLQEFQPEKKKKHELGIVDDDGSHKTGLELEDSKGASEPQHKKKKKLGGESESDSEDSDIEEGTAKRKKTDVDDELETSGDGSAKKKRLRKRNKTKKKKEGDHTHGLRILSKNEWRRLRNKYLSLQQRKMQGLKKQLAQSKYGCNYQSPYVSQDNRRDTKTSNQKVNADGNPKIEKTSFVPGVIIKINLQEPLQEVNKFKTNAKAHPEVRYVDANEGESELFIRCATADAAQKLAAEEVWEDMDILEGEAENSYWQKIWEDRNKKVKTKIRANVRGKDKLLKRAERELGKHIKFDN